MAFKNRAADARLLQIANVLQRATDRLTAISHREDAGDPTADPMPTHNKVARLLEEVSKLRPVSDAGFAVKAHIVVAHHELGEAGRVALDSLATDLQTRSLRRRSRSDSGKLRAI